MNDIQVRGVLIKAALLVSCPQVGDIRIFWRQPRRVWQWIGNGISPRDGFVGCGIGRRVKIDYAALIIVGIHHPGDGELFLIADAGGGFSL